MAQKHNAEYTEKPMTRDGRIQGPSRRYRRLRHPTFEASVWADKNPLLQRGEIGYEVDTHKVKVGDGVTYWNDLPYTYDEVGQPTSTADYQMGNAQGGWTTMSEAQQKAINSGATTTNIGQIATNTTNISNHVSNTNNPHNVTASQVGLGNVDNTSDADKPISTATQDALDLKANIADLGTAAYTDSTDYATAAQGTKADSALQPGDNVSELVNDAGYLTQHQTLADLGITATASEINVLDGITASTTELNYVDGVTSNIQTQIDGKQTKSTSAYNMGNTSGGWTAMTNTQQDALNSGANTINIGQIATNTSNIADEILDRQNADNGLQSQIDAIVSKSDVVDIVGTYAELQAYDTSSLGNNDVVKVISDSTHNNAPSYYRWVITGGVGAWVYIGSESETYTKAETDALLNAKQDNITATDGITLTGTTLTNSGVRAVASGTTNGTISVNTNGTSADVSVTGLGSAAYTNSSAYATAAQGTKADTAVQPGDLATVATTGDYDDLTNKPTIPTVNNPTITLTQGGVTKGSFTLNQASGDTIALDAGGGSGLPDQTGQSGKFLTTDGTDASWSDKPLVNKATGTDSLTILGTGATNSHSINIGSGSSLSSATNQTVVGDSAKTVGSSSNYVTVLGAGAKVRNAARGIAIGAMSDVNAAGAIQIGTVSTGSATTNSDANTFKVANANGNFEIMSADGTIPEARLANTTGATQGQVLTLDSNLDATWATPTASVAWGGITGTLSDQTDLQDALDSKADTNLSNLTSTGANIGNWSSNVTNCITEIPNDIKMELNTTTHTLTVKAGTKVYIPNGAGVFDTLTLDTDTSTSQTLSTQMNRFVCITTAGALYTTLMTGGTVTSRPTTPINYALYYNTTTNVCEFYNGSQWIQLSFPIGIIMQDSTGVIRLLNVFNGFGYIGSTLFALPGTKGLIANGFNPDGTMKNTFWETENVIIRTLANTVNSADAMILFNGIAFSIMRVGATNYDSATNTIIRTSLPFDVFPYTYVCQCVITAGVISGFGSVVRACAEPKGEINRRSIIQRQNGNPWYIKYADGFVIQGGYVNNLTTTSQRVTFPVPMNGTNYTVALGAYIGNATPQIGYIRSNLNSTGFDYKAGAATIDRACWIVAGVYA
jgi:hypothetical protein